MCLGHEDRVDLKAALRDGGVAALDAAIDDALAIKPARHDFRPRRRRARGRAPHERHRRMSDAVRRALVASPTHPAQVAAEELSASL